jgi:hypothetical protein
MWTRSVIAAGFVIGLLSQHAMAAPPCSSCSTAKKLPLDPLSADSSLAQFEPKALRPTFESSLRGLSLTMHESEAQAALHRLGFDLVSLPTDVNAMDICRKQTKIGTVRFDQNREIQKLELSPLFFAVGKVVLREFADSVFKHYKVRSLSADDDVCYHDVTCFRGTTTSEQFLIVRIANDVQLHISKRRSGLTQR